MARGTAKLTLFAAFLLLSLVKADWPSRGSWGDGDGPWDGSWDGNGNPWGGDDDGDDDDNNNGNTNLNSTNGFGLGSLEDFNRASKILIAHAVIASLVWVMFIPSGAILLRLGLKNPIVLKLHAVLQILSYFLYIVAAGMGIWLAQQTSQFGIWEDPHPRLGLAILAIAFFQPIIGFIHHRIFKRRSANLQAGKATKPPGRTIIGRMHLWVGRSLIVLGMINGGLGIRLASLSPFQTDETTRKAKIAYSVVAAAMFALYASLVIIFEIRRKRAQSQTPVQGARGTAHNENLSKLPTYDESQSEESSQRGGAQRYQ